ncbi:MAG: hypothetical protein ACOC0U_02550 [Desulfovibrionales bacterium]
MKVNDITPASSLPTIRNTVVSITIKSFKGRRDVDVHLFRAKWDPEEMATIDWPHVLEETAQNEQTERSKQFLMEAFTRQEKETLVRYLMERYSDRLSEITASPLTFPIPTGIAPLSRIPLGSDIGVIRFERIPNYTLPFIVHGLYDLSQHRPLVSVQEADNP